MIEKVRSSERNLICGSARLYELVRVLYELARLWAFFFFRHFVCAPLPQPASPRLIGFKDNAAMLRAHTRSLYQSLVTVSFGSVLTDGAFYFFLLGGWVGEVGASLGNRKNSLV